jgi:hypothetical protein
LKYTEGLPEVVHRADNALAKGRRKKRTKDKIARFTNDTRRATFVRNPV